MLVSNYFFFCYSFICLYYNKNYNISEFTPNSNIACIKLVKNGNKNQCWANELLPIKAKFFNFKSLSPTYLSFVSSYWFITYGFVIPILKSIGFVIGLCNRCICEELSLCKLERNFIWPANSSSYLFCSSLRLIFSI